MFPILAILSMALVIPVATAKDRKAKNVILFLGDAGGIPTLHAASIHGYGAPGKLFLHQIPNIGLSETSPVGAWVTDSAAGMTAIVTGQKTRNNVVSQSADAVPGKSDGAPLKTILEYAEEHGLSTGVISNTSMADATPAACYAHANHRRKFAEIVAQIAKPRFGDGVDLVIGGGRKGILDATKEAGHDFAGALTAKGYTLYDRPEQVPASNARRIVALFDAPYDPQPVVEKAIQILSRNPKGFFLMVEWDMHTDKLQRGLDQAVAMDKLVRKTAESINQKDTLLLFTADHSFDLRTLGGKPGEPVIPAADADPARVPVRVGTLHTGEEVLIAALGPGSERVKGYMPNTKIFHILMQSYGWKPNPSTP
ncbi:alkaline phosphatase [Bryobacterales bacterium F-183]|nr:alkaline phosphatase [Bryobacterales bacterium F-183]